MYRVGVIHVQSGGDSYMYRVGVIHTCTEWR